MAIKIIQDIKFHESTEDRFVEIILSNIGKKVTVNYPSFDDKISEIKEKGILFISNGYPSIRKRKNERWPKPLAEFRVLLFMDAKGKTLYDNTNNTWHKLP